MLEKHVVHNFGALKIYIGEVTKGLFSHHDLWYEYDNPEEISVLNSTLRKIILENQALLSRTSNDHLIYSIPDSCTSVSACSLIMKATITIGHKNYDGFLSIIDSQVASISIFFQNIVLDFYSSNLFIEDNQYSLNILGVNDHIGTIGYQVSQENRDKFDYRGKYACPQ